MVGGPFSATADRGEMLTFPFAGSLPRLRSYETGGEATSSLASAVWMSHLLRADPA
jgi:hypothetical protein